MSKVITPATVRSFVAARPALVAKLSPEAQANLTSRGRVHGEVIHAFNVKRSKDKRYVEGMGRQAAAQRKAQRAADVAAGKAGLRGPVRKPSAANGK
jgi:hypothetical protein